MSHKNFPKIQYNDLNDRQKEAFNYQTVSALLAEYGFLTIKLSDDWNGADFIALHCNREHELHVQLKARLTIAKKYHGKNIWIAFPNRSNWYLIPHDELMEFMLQHSTISDTSSWKDHGGYSMGGIPKYANEYVSAFQL